MGQRKGLRRGTDLFSTLPLPKTLPLTGEIIKGPARFVSPYRNNREIATTIRRRHCGRHLDSFP
jgi:hypothetical protein